MKRRESPNNEEDWLFFLVTALPDNMRKNLPKRMSSHFDVKNKFRSSKNKIYRQMFCISKMYKLGMLYKKEL